MTPKQTRSTPSISKKVDKAFIINVIRSHQLSTVFQPIVDMRAHRIVGYEALTRITAQKTPFTIEQLFTVACKTGLCLALDKKCRDTAIISAGKLKRGKLLFINIDPDTLNYAKPSTTPFFDYTDFDPHDIVLEFTERAAVKNFRLFRKAIHYFKSLGFKVAVDDVGSGYANMRRVAELEPDFIKVGMRLTHNVDKHPQHYKKIKSIIVLAHTTKSVVIAEGIETQEELQTLCEVGVDVAQGFLLARPQKKMVDHITVQLKMQ